MVKQVSKQLIIKSLNQKKYISHLFKITIQISKSQNNYL